MSASEETDPRVSQASGMVSVQAECSVADALELMRARARATDETLLEIANAVVERRTRFAPP
jgi:hypothetical protein